MEEHKNIIPHATENCSINRAELFDILLKKCQRAYPLLQTPLHQLSRHLSSNEGSRRGSTRIMLKQDMSCSLTEFLLCPACFLLAPRIILAL
ncbi:hypothetical protein SDJN03_16577, partial [Cucurbita argyrosperma subsp. sororia]